MLMNVALQGVTEHKEALLALDSASNPTYISYHAHRLAQYLSVVDDYLSDLILDLETKEANSFKAHMAGGLSANASKEVIRREFIEDRAKITKMTRLISAGWKLVNESQSRVKHLIAEANNQI